MKKLNINKNGKPCIYGILNTINNKIYIGSAVGHYRRKGQHFYMLRNNIHYNKHLQSSWNIYREQSFLFKILEFVSDVEMLEQKEEFWMKIFSSNNPIYGYNIRTDCKTNLNNKWSLESRQRFSESKKGKKILHLDYKEIAKKNRKKVTAIDITTKEIKYFDSIKEASEILLVERTSISKALHGTIKSAKGHYWNFTE